MLTYCC